MYKYEINWSDGVIRKQVPVEQIRLPDTDNLVDFPFYKSIEDHLEMTICLLQVGPEDYIVIVGLNRFSAFKELESGQSINAMVYQAEGCHAQDIQNTH